MWTIDIYESYVKFMARENAATTEAATTEEARRRRNQQHIFLRQNDTRFGIFKKGGGRVSDVEQQSHERECGGSV